jgi:hypothetical protein
MPPDYVPEFSFLTTVLDAAVAQLDAAVAEPGENGVIGNQSLICLTSFNCVRRRFAG